MKQEIFMKEFLVGIIALTSLVSYASDCMPADAIVAAKSFLSENYDINNDVKATALLNKSETHHTIIFTYQEEIVGYNSVAKFPMGGYLTVEKANCKVDESEILDSGLLE
jgi:hypothetical protein